MKQRVVFLFLALLVSSVLPALSDSGVFRLVYDEPKNGDLSAALDLVRSSGVFENAVDDLNRLFALPRDVTIRFADAPDAPYYQAGEVVLGYQFIRIHAVLFNEYGYVDSPEALAASLLEVTEFALYHEVGHALIDVYDLPVLGREEDAADHLAVLMALSLDLGDIAVVAADALGLFAEVGEKDESAFWGEHSLNEQRMYTTLCLIYGSDPQRYAHLVVERDLPDDYEKRCVADLEEKRRSWTAVLRPYLKTDFS